MNSKHLWMTALCLAASCSSDPKRDWDAIGDKASKSDGGRSSRADAGPEELDVCGKHFVRSDVAIPDMLIVLDRSGSMAPMGNPTGTDRWSGSRDAVIEVTSDFDDGISFGLMTFPAFEGRSGGRGNDLDLQRQCVAGTVNVEIGPNAGPAIADALEPMNASGYTPTAATLEAALGVIGTPQTADQTLTTAKYILLVTDGDPNCSQDFRGVGSGFSQVDERARRETIAAIEKLTEQGVQTFVVGFQTASSSFADQLNKMAVAGGTGDVMHRSVESGDDLADTFSELAGRARSCSFKLAKEVDPTFVLVTVGKTARKFENPTDGWVLAADRRSVTLTGAACTDVQKGQLFQVEVQCDPVTLI